MKQLNHLIITLMLATSILYLPSITLKESGNGGWLSPAVSMLPALMVMVVVFFLNKQYPGKTIVQYLPELTGTFVAKWVGFAFSLFNWTSGMLVLQELMEFVHKVALPKTPELAINFVVFAAIAFALYAGLEGLARVNDVVYLCSYFLFLVLLVGLFGTVHFSAFVPLLDKGWQGVVRGAFIPGCWFTQVAILGMFLPSVMNQKHGLRTSLGTIVMTCLLLMGSTFLVISVLGAPEAERASLPTFEIIKYISWGEFFQHVDTLFIVPWIAVMFIKAIIFLYAGLLGFAQTVHISRHQSLIIPLCLCSIILNQWVFPSEVVLSNFLFSVIPIYAYLFEMVLPIVLFLLYYMRSGKTKRIDEA